MSTIKMPNKPNIGQNLLIFGIIFGPFILSGLLFHYRIVFWVFLIFWLIVAFSSYNYDIKNYKHQRLMSKLLPIITNYINIHNSSCEVLQAPFAVFLNKDDINYVEPDIFVVCDSSKLDNKGCHGAPDWVIEIVSPRYKPIDYSTKLFKYHNAGVRECWIVDPTKELVMVYRFERETMEQYSFGEEVPVGIYEGFSIKVE